MQQVSANLVNIGEVILHGIVFDFKNSQGGIVNTEFLFQNVDRLFETLEERSINYLLVGGIAMLTYVEGRNTQDIDLILSVTDLKKLPEIQIEDQNEYFAKGNFDNLRVDFLLTRNRLFKLVSENYSTIRQFSNRSIRCATVEGLLLLKTYALSSLYRQGNFVRVGLYENDIAALLQQYKPNIADLFNVLSKHLNESEMIEVKQIIDEIQQRIRRFEKK